MRQTDRRTDGRKDRNVAERLAMGEGITRDWYALSGDGPERAYVDVSHASLGVVGLEVARFGRVDDAVQPTFHLDALARLDTQVRVRLEPVVRPRHQHTAAHTQRLRLVMGCHFDSSGVSMWGGSGRRRRAWAWLGSGTASIADFTDFVLYTVRQKIRNRFSFVCVFLMLNRNWRFFSHTSSKVYYLQFRIFNFGTR